MEGRGCRETTRVRTRRGSYWDWDWGCPYTLNEFVHQQLMLDIHKERVVTKIHERGGTEDCFRHLWKGRNKWQTWELQGWTHHSPWISHSTSTTAYLAWETAAASTRLAIALRLYEGPFKWWHPLLNVVVDDICNTISKTLSNVYLISLCMVVDVVVPMPKSSVFIVSYRTHEHGCGVNAIHPAGCDTTTWYANNAKVCWCTTASIHRSLQRVFYKFHSCFENSRHFSEKLPLEMITKSSNHQCLLTWSTQNR